MKSDYISQISDNKICRKKHQIRTKKSGSGKMFSITKSHKNNIKQRCCRTIFLLQQNLFKSWTQCSELLETDRAQRNKDVVTGGRIKSKTVLQSEKSVFVFVGWFLCSVLEENLRKEAKQTNNKQIFLKMATERDRTWLYFIKEVSVIF